VKPQTHENVALASGSIPPFEPEAAARPVVSVSNVTKSFGSGSQRVVALEGVTLDVNRGDFVCLLGASGCGKSTLLNLVAGLDKPTSGTVEVRAHRTGLMFQEAALFPWLTVRGNVEIALKLAGMPRHERRPRAQELLEMVHLGDFAKRRPHELSGGMRQRAALARALARDADVLLMDEPFGALDAMTKATLQDEVLRLHARTGTSFVFITHDIDEAVYLGDRIAVLGGPPGHLHKIIEVTLARPRDQIETRQSPDFLRYRLEVHAAIMDARRG